MNLKNIFNSPNTPGWFTFLTCLILYTNSQVRGAEQITVLTNKPKYWTILDPSKGKQLLQQCSRDVPDSVESFWELKQTDIDSMEKLLPKILNLTPKWTSRKIPSLERYGFQYIGLTIKGRKYIYINAFLIGTNDVLESYFKEWEKEPIVVCDGGMSFWGVLFDLEKMEFSELCINGTA